MEEIFCTWLYMHLFLKCPKIEPSHFRFISRFKVDHVLFSQNAPLFYVRKSWNAPFSHLILKMTLNTSYRWPRKYQQWKTSDITIIYGMFDHLRFLKLKNLNLLKFILSQDEFFRKLFWAGSMKDSMTRWRTRKTKSWPPC